MRIDEMICDVSEFEPGRKEPHTLKSLTVKGILNGYDWLRFLLRDVWMDGNVIHAISMDDVSLEINCHERRVAGQLMHYLRLSCRIY